MRYRWLTALLAVAMVVAACGGDTADGDDGDGDELFRIAVVAPSATNDLAFTQSMVDAVNLVADAMGGASAVEVAVTDQTFVVEDAAAAIRDYASDGYDLVIAHGSQYGESLGQIAPEFPDVSFAWGTDTDTFGLDNVYAYTAASDEGGYVQGVMAALLTESGTVGVVGPIEVGDAKAYVDGFVNGAAATDAAVTVNVVYTGSFGDVAAASETANAHIANGADVMTGSAQMVVGAVAVGQQNGTLWFGTQSNQTSLADDIVVSSQVYHWEVILEEIVDNIENGVLGGESFVLTLANGGLVIEFNDGYDLPSDVRDAADQAIDDVAGGMSTGVG